MWMKSRIVSQGVQLVCLPLVFGISMVGAATAQAPEVLLERYKCHACHSDHEPKTGPAYVDVAAAYRSNPQAVTMVASIVKKGAHGGGPWHMPPHPEISDADATRIARYILSLRPSNSEKKD